MPFPTGESAPQGGGSMLQNMRGMMSPGGGMQPDQMGGGGGAPDVQGILSLIESAPPQVLMVLKQAIDAKLAMSQGPGGAPPAGGPPPMQ